MKRPPIAAAILLCTCTIGVHTTQDLPRGTIIDRVVSAADPRRPTRCICRRLTRPIAREVC